MNKHTEPTKVDLVALAEKIEAERINYRLRARMLSRRDRKKWGYQINLLINQFNKEVNHKAFPFM